MEKEKYLLGIDDAGRGPVVGPMIVAGVIVRESKLEEIKEIGVKDSKMLAHSTRERMAKQIEKVADGFEAIAIYPEEIDAAVSKNKLNTLEAEKMAELINHLSKNKKHVKIFVDCPSTNISAWQALLISKLDSIEGKEFFVEHKADVNYPIVSAASILAKVKREEEVKQIKQQHGIEFGSGYPADPSTSKWLKEESHKHKDKGIIRKSWQTYKNLFGEEDQKKLF